MLAVLQRDRDKIALKLNSMHFIVAESNASKLSIMCNLQNSVSVKHMLR